MKTRKTSVVAASAAVIWILGTVASAAGPDLKSAVSGLLARFPAENSTARDAVMTEILSLGAAGIAEICGRLMPPGSSDDSAAQYALNGLAVYVTRPGAEKDRLLFVRAVLGSLGRVPDSEVRAFLISQLEMAGKRESIRPLAEYLADSRLADPAARALLAIGGEEAGRAFLRAMGKVPPSSLPAVVKALGEIRSRAAVKKLLPLAEGPDPTIRRLALYALANIGDPAAGRVLERAPVATSLSERAEAPALLLRYARRLIESGKSSQGLEIARRVFEGYTAPGEARTAADALGLIVSVQGAKALPELLSAMDRDDLAVRGTALELAAAVPGAEATKLWVEKASGSAPEVAAGIIAMLGDRKDRVALEFVQASLRSPEDPVRLAAIPASLKLGGGAVLPDLLALLKTAEGPEHEALKTALLGLPGRLVVPEAVRLINAVSPAARATLLSVLAEKGAREEIGLFYQDAASDDPAVRAAAISGLAKLAGESDLLSLVAMMAVTADAEDARGLQEAVAAAALRIPDAEQRADRLLEIMKDSLDSVRIAVLRVLPRIGGAKALQAVIGEIGAKDALTQGVAIFALSQWPDFAAADELLRVIATTINRKHLLLALEGYVRLVRESGFPVWKKLALLETAFGLPKDEADRKAVLLGLEDLRDPLSVRLLGKGLEIPALRDTAASVLLDMASEQGPEERWLSGHLAISVLRRAEDLISEPTEKERAEKIIAERLKQGGFVPLFNGKDLEGWKGLVVDPPKRAKMTVGELAAAQAGADERMRAHWRVADGVLAFDGGGESLCTAKDYGDFEMLVDWKIDKGGDSGIYLRGSPQVQIWDAAANPAGSGGLYNNQKGASQPLAAADRPVGDWNTFRIMMIGERVTVYLNDRMAVDNTVLENYWERDKPIYESGQIELQAHGNPLSFRNIYVREIPRDTAVPAPAEAEKDEGFTALFNGRDLAGWTGDTAGYVAENGKIVIHPGRGSGNLYTEKEYADFVLRFEFVLTPAANNGLGVRAPLEGDAAYAGMEVQILEDGSPVYWDLQPYQFHGSVYGIAPARRGVLRPPGEWNSEEVTVQGRRVSVKVNGTTIVDADLDRAADGGTVDGRDHPGLERKTGHIGFLGHGSIVGFRNIRIKELNEQ